MKCRLATEKRNNNYDGYFTRDYGYRTWYGYYLSNDCERCTSEQHMKTWFQPVPASLYGGDGLRLKVGGCTYNLRKCLLWFYLHFYSMDQCARYSSHRVPGLFRNFTFVGMRHLAPKESHPQRKRFDLALFTQGTQTLFMSPFIYCKKVSWTSMANLWQVGATHTISGCSSTGKSQLLICILEPTVR